MKSDVQLNLRAKESQRALIDAAAEILHKSYRFHSEMACQAAECDLDRRSCFNDEQYAEFIDMLDAPVAMIRYRKTAGKETSVGRLTAPEPVRFSSGG
jgi:uncharacterized protein (DUF1778 family)